MVKIGVAIPIQACVLTLQSLSRCNSGHLKACKIFLPPLTPASGGTVKRKNMACAQAQQAMRDGHLLIPSPWQDGQMAEGACLGL